MFDAWTPLDTRGLAVALACNLTCAAAGCFLVLRRKSMVGDALSHAVLPGLVLAFLISHSLSGGVMLLGALGAGLAATFLSELAERRGQAMADASLGVVFTSLFALGVLMVKRFLGGIHFDVACVYEGSLLAAALDTQDLFGTQVPRALPTAALLLAGVGLALIVFWKELVVTTFDPDLAKSMGFSPGRVNYLLMAGVSLAAAASFQTVGSVLAVAMLVVPTATAQYLSVIASRVLGIALLTAGVATTLGYLMAIGLSASPAGAMAVAAGGMFAAVALFAPGKGVVARTTAALALALRVRGEDLLTGLYRAEERHSEVPTQMGTDWIDRYIVWRLRRRGELYRGTKELRLTDLGRGKALEIVRAHRLWESYLVTEVGIAPDHVHDPAHSVEHFLDRPLRQQIEENLPSPGIDPHGRDIPRGKSER